MAKLRLTAATAAALLMAPASWAVPAPLTEPLLPPITAAGTVSIKKVFTVPADVPAAAGSTARVQYVVPDPGSSSRVFINDVNGVLYTSPSVNQTPAPYLDLRTKGIGFLDLAELDGFSGVALHPNFNGNPANPGYGVFYTLSSATTTGAPLTFLTGDAGSHTTALTEWKTTNPAAATFTGTSRTVMTIGDAAGGHNGGTIAFNPTAALGSADYGKLYIGMGDSGFNDPQQNGQALTTPRGKILRIDPAQGGGGQPYTVPVDNPFVGSAGVLPEIWASGLRNPQSFSWDASTGKMYINDIGQAHIDEVNVGAAGANYGWSIRQGTFATGYGVGDSNPNNQNVYTPLQTSASLGLTDPIAEYDHTQGYAVGSGFLYRGHAIPWLIGKYIMADIVNGRLFYFDPNSVAAGQQAALNEILLEQNGTLINLLAQFGVTNPFLISPRVDARLSELADGELVLALKSTGDVYSLGLAASVPEPRVIGLFGVAALMLLAVQAGSGASRGRPRAMAQPKKLPHPAIRMVAR